MHKCNIRKKCREYLRLITKMEIGYEKHPAQSSYMSSVTAEDSTNSTRSNLNIGAKENIKMFRNRSRSPAKGNNSRSGRFKNGGNWRKPWTPGYKTKPTGHNGPANNTIPELKEHYFDCSSIYEVKECM